MPERILPKFHETTVHSIKARLTQNISNARRSSLYNNLASPVHRAEFLANYFRDQRERVVLALRLGKKQTNLAVHNTKRGN